MAILDLKLKNALCATVATISVGAMVACSEDVNSPDKPEHNAIPGKEVGIRSLKVSLPRLSRFDKVVDHVSCRIHLRGREDRMTYPINTFLVSDKDSIYLEADDPVLTELPHQMYHLNAITFPSKTMTSRDGSEVGQDTVYIGARLSIENPDNIQFVSSFDVGANSIGSGTEADPWIIASGDDFLTRVCDPMTRGETHEGKYFEITRNMSLNLSSVTYGKGWEPAGHNNINGGSTDFNGTINGCDNYVDAIYCYSDVGCGGLFYSLGEKAYIHNLEMHDVMLDGKDYIGAFACTSKRGCRLDSVQVTGTIRGNKYVGGLIGSGDADVRVCISSVNISSVGGDDSSSIGGMIGKSENFSFTDCIRRGSINAPQSDNIGGYVGKGIDEKVENPYYTFTRCYSAGEVIGRKSVGGFVGNACSEFTDCHAAASLPQDSYSYTWDVFGVNEMMNPMPLVVKGEENTGGFAGNSPILKLHGDNSFAYNSVSTPDIEGKDYTGALVGYSGWAIIGDGSCTFTTKAYVVGADCTGGAVGFGCFSGVTSFVNYGNVKGEESIGGVVGGGSTSRGDDPVQINCKNFGNVSGKSDVGGVIGAIRSYIQGSVMENYGNVSSATYSAGGLFGTSGRIDLGEGSRVSTENGSITITGNLEVGGISGTICPGYQEYLCHAYCPVYANIVAEEGDAGGLFGFVDVGNGFDEDYPMMFEKHYPVKVSITAKTGGNVGGVMGRIRLGGIGKMIIDEFRDELQVSISAYGDNVGGIIGYFDQHSSYVNVAICHSFATIKCTSPQGATGYGGIIGNSYCTESKERCAITQCSFHGSISGSNMTAVGGIVGVGYDAVTISDSYNAGRIEGKTEVGGIMGRLIKSGTISYCLNMGEVPWTEGCDWLAGIIGHKENDNSDRLDIIQCYNVGGTGWGIVGAEENANISCSSTYYLNTASNGDMPGIGTMSKTADEMRSRSTYPDWIEHEHWLFHDGEAAPTINGVPLFNEKLPLQK